jgi:predicted DNA-binding transcriptional regulator AlpA
METILRLIRDTETATILGCSRATVWALVKTGKIPAPVKIGSMSRWRLSDIQIVIDQAVEKPALKCKLIPRDRKRTRPN